MNVNPFSYLIEKLKGKVDKSGDTMSGVLNVQASNGTPLHIKRTDSSGNVYMGFENANGEVGSYIVGSDKKPYFKPNGGSNTGISLVGDMPTGVLYIASANTYNGTGSVTYTGCPGAYRTPALLVGNDNGVALLAVVMYANNNFNIAAITGQSLTISATSVGGKWDITINGLAAYGNYKLIAFTET